MFRNKAIPILCIISTILLFLMISCKATTGYQSSEDSQELEPKISATDEIFQMPPEGSTIFEFTEEDVVTWMNNFSSQNPDITMSNPNVILDDGICSISAVLDQKSTSSNPLISTLSGNVLMEMSIIIGENDQPSITLNSLTFDSITLPEFLLNQIASMINESIRSSIESDLDGKTIDQILIDNGRILILVSD